MAALPPLPAVGNAIIQVIGPQPSQEGGDWDEANWDGTTVADRWAGSLWRTVTSVSLNAQVSWGADDEVGALSMTSAGSWTIRTYDPNRYLDPSNSESPFFEYMQPGSGVRLAAWVPGEQYSWTVKTGFLDEVSFDMMSRQGHIRASDVISLMVKTRLPAGLAHSDAPWTLRARARWALDKVGMQYVHQEPLPDGTIDPTVGPPPDSSVSAWHHISTAALDCLHAVWIDRNGLLKYAYFGKPVASGIVVGGSGIPIDSLQTVRSLDGVFNLIRHRRGYLDESLYSEARNEQTTALWGELLLQRDRPNPRSYEWVNQMLKDRGAVHSKFEIGTLRIQTFEQLQAITNLGVGDTVQLRVESHGPLVSETVTVLGGTIEADTVNGWSATLLTYQPAEPLTDWGTSKVHMAHHAGNRTRNITSDAAGVAGGNNNPVMEVAIYDVNGGDLRGARMLVNFATPDWSKMTNIVSARMMWYRAPHEDTDRDIVELLALKVQRVTTAWNEVTEVWPGPSATTDGEALGYPPQAGGWMEWLIKDIVMAWAPTSLGGQNQPMHGVLMRHRDDSWHGPVEHAMIAGEAFYGHGPYLLIEFQSNLLDG